jgi:TPR repeat protein
MESSQDDLSEEPDAEALQQAYDLITRKDYVAAIARLRTIAEKGSRLASVYLGWLHEEGLGARQDLLCARKWYERAATRGSSIAQFQLAQVCRKQGLLEEAVKWLSAAASADYLPAIYWLGTMYERGEGCTKDQKKAEAYFEKAYERGHIFAKRDLARRSLTRNGGKFGILRGLRMYIHAVIEAARLARVDPHSERLR